MLVAKLFYFSFFASLSCLFPFLPLFFRRRGLNEAQIGLLAALRPWLSLPAGAAWSGAADKSRRHRAVLLATFCGALACRLALAGAHSYAALAALTLATEAFAAPITIIADSSVLAACGAEGEYGRQRLWGAVGWGAFAFVSGAATARSGSIVAAFVLHGLLGLAALVPTALLPLGPLHAKLDAQAHRGGGDGSDETAAAGAVGGAPVVDLQQQQQQQQQHIKSGQVDPRSDSAVEASTLAVPEADGQRPAEADRSNGDAADLEDVPLLLPKEQRQPHPPAEAASGGDGKAAGSSSRGGGGRVHFWSGMGQLLSCPEAQVFFCQALLIGVGVGNIEGYLFLYLDELGGSEALMGLSLSLTCAAEALVFWAFPALLRTLGIPRCLHLVFLAFLLRLGGYWALSLAPGPAWVLPLETLHGFTFAMAWAAGTAYCGRIAPPGLESSCQSLFQGLMFGLGHGIGGLAGGLIYRHLGARAVYAVAFSVMAVGWAGTAIAEAAVAAAARRRSSDGARGLELVDV